MQKENLTIDGSPYAPISLKKVVDFIHKPGDASDDKSLHVLIDQNGNGIETDHPDYVNVMIADRIEQARYFSEEVFPTLPRIPAYLYRYIHWMMFSEDSKMKYPTDNDYAMALQGGILSKIDEEYQQIEAFIKYSKSNSEATHLIGLVSLIGGTLRSYAKRNSGCKIFIELPETGFHPKREAKIVTLLNMLRDEYGVNPNFTHIEPVK